MPETKFVLTVSNRQCEDSGTPPGVVNDPGKYTAYFENRYGEQLVFQYDRGTHRGILWHGDCGWEEPIEVRDGQATNTVMDDCERGWLELVFKVATEGEVKV